LILDCTFSSPLLDKGEAQSVAYWYLYGLPAVNSFESQTASTLGPKYYEKIICNDDGAEENLCFV
jgi:hypothetical protein